MCAFSLWVSLMGYYWQQLRKLIWVYLFSSVCFIREILVFCNTGKYGQRKPVFWHISQKQPPEVFYKKRCSWAFRKIHRKTPVPGTLFKQSWRPRPAILLKKSLWHRCFPVNFVKFPRTTFLQNTSGRLLLILRSVSFCILIIHKLSWPWAYFTIWPRTIGF